MTINFGRAVKLYHLFDLTINQFSLEPYALSLSRHIFPILLSLFRAGESYFYLFINSSSFRGFHKNCALFKKILYNIDHVPFSFRSHPSVQLALQ